MSTNNIKFLNDINLNKLFSLNKVEANSSQRSTANVTTNSDGTTTSTYIKTTTTTKCKNGATNPPTCTKLSTGKCIAPGDTSSTICPTVTGLSTTYLPMASAGQALTAGMVETDANVIDARKKYLNYISETESILKELNAIAADYNDIIKEAQSTSGLTTGSNNLCTFSQLIQYQTN